MDRELVSDEELMLRAAAGEVAAFEALVLRWEGPLYNFLLRFAGEEDLALEVRQETFLKAFAARRRYRPTAKFSTWLYTIALNAARSELRKRGTRAKHIAVDAEELLRRVPDARGNPSQEAEREELAALIEEALAALPPEQREVVMLRHFGGLSFPQIAQVVGCPLSTAKSRMTYALARLGSLLGPALAKGDEDEMR